MKLPEADVKINPPHIARLLGKSELSEDSKVTKHYFRAYEIPNTNPSDRLGPLFAFFVVCLVPVKVILGLVQAHPDQKFA
jgi:hypothetical protein